MNISPLTSPIKGGEREGGEKLLPVTHLSLYFSFSPHTSLMFSPEPIVGFLCDTIFGMDLGI